jgi:hypothetical protein
MAELLSIAFMSCNRVERVAQSLGSVLAQTLDDVEVLICDDASSDGTYEVLQQIVAGYRGGKRLRLLRNESRLGVIGNFNRIMAQAQSDYVMFAHDDDLSVPERAQTVRQAIFDAAAPPSAVFHDAFSLDAASGQSQPAAMWPRHVPLTPESIARHGFNVVGAVATYSRRVVEEFGPVPQQAHFEDACCLFRAALLGPVICIARPLIHKRLDKQSLTGGASVFGASSGREVRLAMIRNIRDLSATPTVWAADLQGFAARLPGGAARAQKIVGLLDVLRRRVQGELDMLEHRPRALAYWLPALLRRGTDWRDFAKLALVSYCPELWRRYAQWRYRRLVRADA